MARLQERIRVVCRAPEGRKRSSSTAISVIAGLVIFLVLVTIPLWQNLGKTVPAPTPKLDTPAIIAAGRKGQQVRGMPKEWMRANHMQMLVDWRDERGPQRQGANVLPARAVNSGPDGNNTLASLSNTCLECHSNKS